MTSTSKRAIFLLGVRDTVPMMIAAIPFAIVFGALAQTNGMSIAATIGMSAIVFAGASQFVAVTLLALETTLPIIILTVFVVNLRHLLYSVGLMPLVSDLPQKLRVIFSFWLTDEIFASVKNRTLRGFDGDDQPNSFTWLYFGAAFPFYCNWIFFTIVGIVMGQEIPKLTEWGLDIAMVVAFVGIVVPILKNKAQWACAITAFVSAVATHDWPHQSGLLFSSLAAIAVGVLLIQRVEK